jgi:hypothetical protein
MGIVHIKFKVNGLWQPPPNKRDYRLAAVQVSDTARFTKVPEPAWHFGTSGWDILGFTASDS